MYTLILFVMFSIGVIGDDRPDLAADKIPILLRINANKVTRLKSVHHHIKDLDNRHTTYKNTYTVFNKDNDPVESIWMYYLKGSSKISDIDIRIYDSKGKIIKKVKGKEIEDYSASSGSTMVSSGRYKRFKYTSDSYPYTISYEYSLKTNNTLDLGYWQPGGYGVAVEQDEYSVTSDVPFDLLTKVQNIENYDIEVDLVNRKFVAKNLPALQYEDLQPQHTESYPLVKLSPKHFEYEGYEGTVSNWKEFGEWKYQLVSDRQEVTPAMIVDLDKIISESDTNIDKIDKIYRYMANNTRYVSIQLGIGGLRPFEASEVHELKYGDCKGLSNYTVSLMEYYGIEALYTVIENNRQFDVSFDEDIPDVYQGNHIITCVPNGGDTLWLECTSKTYPTGFIGGSNHNRKVLLISEDGGKIVRTKKYEDEDNLREVVINMVIDENYEIDITYDTEYHNLSAARYYSSKYDTESEQKESFDKRTQKAYASSSYSLEMADDKALIIEKASLQTKKPLKAMAGYVMITPNVMYLGKMEELKDERKSNIYIKDGNVVKGIAEIAIPIGHKVVDGEKEFEVKTEFGSASYKVTQKDATTVIVAKKIERWSGTFDKSKVDQYNQLVQAVNKVNSFQIAIKKEK